MIIVLIIAMVSTSIFTSTRGRYVKEGMRTSRAAPKEEADKKDDKLIRFCFAKDSLTLQQATLKLCAI